MFARAKNVMCRPYGTRLIFVHVPRTSVLGYPLAPLRGWIIPASRLMTYAVGFIRIAEADEFGDAVFAQRRRA